VTETAAENQNPYRRSLLRRERSQDTRRRLVRAAARLWSQKGYDGTTVEEICAAAGVGRTTFYLHFVSKEQLLVDLTWATTSGVASDVDTAVGAGGIDEQLNAFIDGLARRMDTVPKSLAALVIRHAVAGTAPSRRPPGGLLFEDILAPILREAQRRGEIAPDLDASELGAILGGMTMDALQRWAEGRDGNRSLRDSLQLRVDLILDGIRR